MNRKFERRDREDEEKEAKVRMDLGQNRRIYSRMENDIKHEIIEQD